MSAKFKWLQFFADGASGGDGGGDGAGTGVTSADAGQSTGDIADDAGQRLEALGVPKDKAEKYSKKMAKRSQQRAQDNAEDPKPAEQQKAAMPSWDEYMKDPENKKRLEEMMAARGRSATEERNAAQEQMQKLSSALELLSVRYGKETKDGQYDIDGLVEAITGDDLFFEDKALESGESVEKVKSDWQKEREEARQKQMEREMQLQKRFQEMQQQIPVVQEEFPNFDFNKEMENPEFVHLANSRELGGMGWDLKRAFRAVHQEEIERQQAAEIAQRVKSDTARVVQSNQTRPRENGSAAATVLPANDYESAKARFRNMTPEERRRYIQSAYPPR